MLSINGYSITETLYDSSRTLICKAVRQSDSRPVILKLLRSDYPTLEEKSSLNREFSLIRQLNETGTKGVVEVLDLVTSSNRQVIVMPDTNSRSLASILSQGPMDVPKALKTFAELAGILGRIHAQHIIHKDLNPSNIIVNTKTGEVQLIDFGIASQLPLETPTMEAPEQIQGKLVYISPEQTGRMNRAVDYRTDFYSLGVSLYQAISGHPPFSSDDHIDMLHCHLARTPRPLSEAAEHVPDMVSRIVMRLLNKNPDHRYQSALGIKADLCECLSAIEEGKTPLFEIGRFDISDRLTVSGTLYGRETETATLLRAFERVSKGRTELIMVAGYSGIGKSSLVNEVHKPITAKRGEFISGKCEQYQRNIPYFAISQAFSSLCNRLLAQSEQSLESWRSRISRALGDQGQIIVDMIPKLELVIGKQPPLDKQSAADAHSRFNFLFERFIRVFASKDHPLVIFLDDLQWVDSASLNLIHFLITEADLDHLLVIGAYRDNEVETSHPLAIALDQLRKTETVETISVPPLLVDDLNQLIADSLHLPTSNVTALGALVHSKTGGNPFFVNAFLKTLYKDKLLWFDMEAGAWTWDMNAIRAAAITDNVVELMVQSIRRLPEETQQALQFGACIGTIFSLDTLALVSDSTPRVVAEALWPAVREGMLTPLGEGHRILVEMSEELDEGTVTAQDKFQHDRILQAAYELIPEELRTPIHLRIGRLLLSELHEQGLENDLGDPLFFIVDQLNKGRALMTDAQERLQLARLNLQAAGKAMDATAYGACANHCASGIELIRAEIGDACWESMYELTFALHCQWAESTYLNGDFAKAEELFQICLNQAKSREERSRIYRIMMLYHTNINEFTRNIELGIEALKDWGVDLSKLEDQFDTDTIAAIYAREMAEYATMLEGRKISELADLPTLDDKAVETCIDFLVIMVDSAYLGNPGILGLLTLLQVNLSMRHGNSPLSPSGYVWWGVLLIFNGEHDNAYEFGKLALALAGREKNDFISCRANHMFGGFIQLWKDPLEQAIGHLKKAFQHGNNGGDINFSNYAATIYNRYAFYQGGPLPSVAMEARTCLHFMEKTKHQGMHELHNTIFHANMSLQGLNPSPLLLNENEEVEQNLLQSWEDNQMTLQVALHSILKLFLCYTFEQYDDAVRYGEKAEANKMGIFPQYDVIQIPLYHGLALTALYPQADEETRKGYLLTIDGYMEELSRWTELCHQSCSHKLYLLKAERARILKQDTRAMSLYEQAAELARNHGFGQEEALAHELYAKFWLQQGRNKIASLYMAEAHYAYRSWGAHAKVADIEKRYTLLSMQGLQKDDPGYATITVNATSTTKDIIDLSAVMRMSQAISGEIILENLQRKLLEMVMEVAGAEKVFLILKNGSLHVHGGMSISGNVQNENSSPLAQNYPVALDSFTAICAAVVKYTARTESLVVLDNAVESGMFVQDDYIVANTVRSILSIPLMQQGALTGVLYLENNLTSNAFTGNRVEILSLLASQAAISIQNAQFYSKLIASEQTLRASEERFRAVFDSVNDAIFVLDYETAETINVNATACDMFNVNREELVSKKVWEFYDLDSVSIDEVRSNIRRAASEDLPLYNREYHLPCGKSFIGEVNLRRAFVGNDLRVLAVVRDISERMEREQAERDKVAAELANQAKSEFLANMSHEIRTPINAITGLTYLAMQTDLSPRQHDYLKKIQTSTNNLLGVINDILDFSKIEAGKLDMECTNFSLDEVLDNVANMVNTKAEEKGLEVIFRIMPDVPLALVGDPLRLGQVLINLASNAVKFTDNGEIVISTKLVQENDNTVRLQFSTSDTGIGMNEGQIAKLFNPFTQADTTTTRKYGGTGLGLTISRHLVEMMDGAITATSAPGHGSTFTFDASFAKQEHTGQQTFSVPNLKGKNVLVVEDNDTAREYFQQMLEFFGFTVFTADSSQGAIDIVDSIKEPLRLDLILMDYSLPEVNGVETLTYLSKRDGELRAPVIIMTSPYAPQEEIDAAHEIGVFNFLMKPVNPSSLFNALMEALGKSHVSGSGFIRKHQPESTRLVFSNAQVLLVEDNVINQQVAQEILEQSGLSVEIAENGQEAIRAIETKDYDLVFMDIQMPVMDGIRATQALRANAEIRQVPIVALTAHALSNERDKCLAAGMDDYLSKPLQVDQLFALLEKYIGPGTVVRTAKSGASAEGDEQSAPAQLEKLDEIPEKLGLSELDINTGLGIVAGNMDLYLKLLNTFRKDFSDVHDRLASALENGNRTDAERTAHSVKGVAANIGLKELKVIADRLETTIPQSALDECTGLLESFETTLKQALRDVSAFLEYSAGAGALSEKQPAETVSAVDVSELLETLKKNLENGNADAEDQLSALKTVLAGKGVDDDLAEIEQHLELYDFEQALQAALALGEKL